jgi:CBS-domain-containing membrane protein
MITLQKLKVKDAYRLDKNQPILIKLSAEFSQVIINFTHHVELRGIFVVDDKNRFLGVITRTDLLDWARVKLGAITLQPLTDMNKTIRLATLIRASQLGDILRPETKQAAVRVDDNLGHALKVMVNTDLIVLPVINDEKRVIGKLKLSEVLSLVLDES